MTLWVLDTDHVTLHQHLHPLVTRRVASIASDDLAVTVVTAEEQLRGRLNIRKKI
jgi:tRNA(fMet)-specific endonuclease VapC